jgi:HD superfamily phosphodiesterase
MTTTNRNALLETPDVPWASDAIELVFTQESRSVANHSARSWIFARMLRDHLNLTQEVDETLLFAATLLHDIGLRRDARDPVRFEIDGADRAAEFLTAQGLDAAQVDKVWEAKRFIPHPEFPNAAVR